VGNRWGSGRGGNTDVGVNAEAGNGGTAEAGGNGEVLRIDFVTDLRLLLTQDSIDPGEH
jgi:hypothetical protein